MPKAVNEELMSIYFKLRREGGEGPVSVGCTVEYTVTSEDLEVTRTITPELTEAQKTTVTNFAASMLTKVNEAEGIV